METAQAQFGDFDRQLRDASTSADNLKKHAGRQLQRLEAYRLQLQNYMEMTVDINRRLNRLFAAKTTTDMEHEFEELCRSVAYYLAHDFYGGAAVKDKVAFVSCNSVVAVSPPNVDRAQELQHKLLAMPMAIESVAYGTPQFEADVKAHPEKFRDARGRSCAPDGAGSIMIVPIVISPREWGVFGLYTSKKGFFQGPFTDAALPLSVKAILEVAAKKVCTRHGANRLRRPQPRFSFARKAGVQRDDQTPPRQPKDQ